MIDLQVPNRLKNARGFIDIIRNAIGIFIGWSNGVRPCRIVVNLEMPPPKTELNDSEWDAAGEKQMPPLLREANDPNSRSNPLSPMSHK